MGKGIGAVTGAIGGVLGGITGGLLNPMTNALTRQAAQVNPGIDQGQINTSYAQAQDAIQQQNAFLQALQAQNGVGNQQSVFNQLQGVANGTGPNPALAQLNQTTGQNIANQAALMASARGAQQNAGQIARLAGQQGGNIQQQAAGQAAALQAQQQLNALSQLGGVAGQQVAQQQNAITGANQFAQGQEQNLLGALGKANDANAGINKANAEAQNKMTGGFLNAIGAAGGIGGGGKAHGGLIEAPVQHLAFGGLGAEGMPQQPPAQSFNLTGVQPTNAPSPNLGVNIAIGPPAGQDPVAAFMSGQPYVEQAREKDQGRGGGSFHAFESYDGAAKGVFAKGGQAVVPGKAKVKGDSLKNDVVPAVLSPGEIVIPRSIAQGKNAPENAAKFVASVLAKKRKKLG